MASSAFEHGRRGVESRHYVLVIQEPAQWPAVLAPYQKNRVRTLLQWARVFIIPDYALYAYWRLIIDGLCHAREADWTLTDIPGVMSGPHKAFLLARTSGAILSQQG